MRVVEAKKRLGELSELKVLIRDETDTLLEIEASQAATVYKQKYRYYKSFFMHNTKVCLPSEIFDLGWLQRKTRSQICPLLEG